MLYRLSCKHYLRVANVLRIACWLLFCQSRVAKERIVLRRIPVRLLLTIMLLSVIMTCMFILSLLLLLPSGRLQGRALYTTAYAEPNAGNAAKNSPGQSFALRLYVGGEGE